MWIFYTLRYKKRNRLGLRGVIASRSKTFVGFKAKNAMECAGVAFESDGKENERTPESGREPTAYIIVLINTKIKQSYVDYDVGAAVENILLGAVNLGLGACWMGSINHNKIRSLLKIPDFYQIVHVISLGYPDEKSVIEPYVDSFQYWKDENGMHIPKRNLEDILFKIF